MHLPSRLHPRPAARLATLALALAFTAACNVNFGTGIEARNEWDKTYKVTSGATLELRETNGRIRVEAGSASDEIVVHAVRVVKGPTEEAAKAGLAEVTIKEIATADRIEIDSTDQTRGFMSRLQRRVDYDVKMPKTGHLTIKSTNGEITVRSVAGLLRIETVNGEIELTGVEQGADVTAVNGRVQVEVTSLGEQGVRCKTTNGQIIVTIPTATKANLAARVSNGVVRTENLSVQTSESSHRRLDGTIGGGGPEIRLDSTNGEVRIVGK
jgi:DUF4097 and DUF4098 domain-containing protein YvlB